MFVAVACCSFVLLLCERLSGASLFCLYGCCFLFFPPIFLGVGEQVEIQEFLNTSNAPSKGGVADLFKDPRVSTERQMQCKQFAKLCAPAGGAGRLTVRAVTIHDLVTALLFIFLATVSFLPPPFSV